MAMKKQPKKMTKTPAPKAGLTSAQKKLPPFIQEAQNRKMK